MFKWMFVLNIASYFYMLMKEQMLLRGKNMFEV